MCDIPGKLFYNPTRCPKCGSNDHVIPIVYGIAPLEFCEMAMRGEIELGGGIIQEDAPVWVCKRCENRFGSINDRQESDLARFIENA